MKNKIMHMLFKFINETTLRKKLLISYFVLILIPLGIVTYVSYVNVSREFENQVRYSAIQSFDQAYTFLSNKVNTLINASDIVYFNSDVQTILERDKKTFKTDYIQQNIDMINLDRFLNNFRNSDDIYRVALYVPSWFFYSDQNKNYLNLDKYGSTAEYKSLMESKSKVFWLPAQKIPNEGSGLDPVSVVSLLRKIRNISNLREYIGIMKICILESSVKDIIKKANTTPNGIVYLQNSNGDFISCSDWNYLKKLGIQTELRKSLPEEDITWQSIMVSKCRYAITAKSVANTDWTMIIAIPYKGIFAQSIKIRNLMIIIAVIIGIIAYIIAYFFSASITSRIVLLMKKMSKVQEGDLDVRVIPHNKDEIGKLMERFNYMVDKIRVLVDEQYKNGKELKSAELRALQAQINPHFLYNTLDLINWKAIDNDMPEVAEIAQSLAKFYKLSLNNGRDIISIENEINHVKSYVQIQNYRFSDRITLILDIENAILPYSILKIILQPIVENSILHGILENRDKQEGRIKITGKLIDAIICITVQDDGVGMTQERVEEILKDDAPENKKGYGISNINKRIKLYYGQQYGLTYSCAPGEGTTVEIKIPAVRDMELGTD